MRLREELRRIDVRHRQRDIDAYDAQLLEARLISRLEALSSEYDRVKHEARTEDEDWRFQHEDDLRDLELDEAQRSDDLRHEAFGEFDYGL